MIAKSLQKGQHCNEDDWTSVLNALIMNAPLIINAIVDGINKLRKK